jgi:hypothetical protein
MTGRLTVPRRAALTAVLAAVLSGGMVIAPALAMAAPGQARAANITTGAARAAAGAAPAQSAPAAPWPVTVTVRTVPALPGVRFTLDGTALTTGRDGTATHTGQHNFGQHTLRLTGSTVVRQDRQYRFTRWAGQRDPDQAFRATVHGLPMRADYAITAAFSVWCPVTPHFTDQHGRRLDPARMAAVTVRSDTGQAASLRPSGTTWLQCARPVARGSTLRSQDVQYSVQRVLVSGANVVHAGIERFWPGRTQKPTITGYFHDLTITAHDALFGGGTGQEALITLPDHTVVAEPLGPGHTAVLSNLPQGSYQVRVKAGGAIVSAQTVRLSRDVTVDLTAVSRADLAALGGGLFVAVAGLPLLSGPRRRWVAGHLRRLRKGAGSA